jgi:hypothetical protein
MENISNKSNFKGLIPWQIWIVVILLALEGIGNLFEILHQPQAIIWLAAKILFITGLLKFWRIVFLLFVIIGVIHVVYFATYGYFFISLINLVLVILTLSTYRCYFPQNIENVI